MIDVLSKKALILSKTSSMMLKNVYISKMVERFRPMFTKVFLMYSVYYLLISY